MNPGPGSYDTGNIFASLSGKMGRATRGDMLIGKNASVGPGSYEIEGLFQKKNKGWSISKQAKGFNIVSQTPGPGSYDYEYIACIEIKNFCHL